MTFVMIWHYINKTELKSDIVRLHVLSKLLNDSRGGDHFILCPTKIIRVQGSAVLINQKIHRFFLYPLNPSFGSRGCWSLSQRSSGERRGTPWTGRQSIAGPHRDKRDKQPHTLTLTPKDNLKSPINLTCMFFWTVGGSQRTRREPLAYTRRTCKLHTERPQPGDEPGTLLL